MLKQEGNKLYRRQDKELLLIEPWGKNSLRVRATQRHEFLPDGNGNSALLAPSAAEAEIAIDGKQATITNGKITCTVSENGELQFCNQDGEVLLEEYSRVRDTQAEGRNRFASALEIVPRTFNPRQSTDHYRLTVRFESNDGEKLYGMGQYQQPFLDLKGCVIELAHRNSQASVPFVLSDRGYGMLWNNPAIGHATFGKNVTEWVAESTKQMDYWITAGDTPAQIEEAYADATGKVPMMPEYGMGFWQCKLRYQTQDEILEVAREYKRRGLPIDVIVADYFHWPHQGDWKFDEDYWPDPAAMVRELKEMGIELMVSIWPTVDAESENYEEMRELGYLTRSEYGKRIGQLGEACFIDVTHPDGRKYVWEKMKKNYYEKGIKIFWLDEAEPEFTDYEFEHYRYFLGADMEVGNIYPKEYARMAYEGMEAEGQKNILNLLRCAWAGSQKYGNVVWSGDVPSTFEAFADQIQCGLNMGLAGIPWWTTDIGGFMTDDVNDPDFQQLLIRWYQFAVYSPVLRMHGDRGPYNIPPLDDRDWGGGYLHTGQPNELWSYGEDNYAIMKKYYDVRQAMHDYIRELYEEAHKNGSPLLRTMFYEFPADAACWEAEDQYMFGSRFLVAPILHLNEWRRDVYLPAGKWKLTSTGEIFDGGRTVSVDAPIDYMPVFEHMA